MYRGDMANFIRNNRKQKGLTQKQLAEKLNVTDKAVSKWERGLGSPDISILLELADALDVSVKELLSGKHEEVAGEKVSDESIDTIVKKTIEYAEESESRKKNNVRKISMIVTTIIFAFAIIVCIICDLAITRKLTWSLYPIVSIIFTWLVILPLFRLEIKSIKHSLISLSIFTIPFLFTLDMLVGGRAWFLSLGFPISLVSLAFLWCVWFVFIKLKISPLYKFSIVLILVIPLRLTVEITVAMFTEASLFNFWDFFQIIIYLGASAGIFCLGLIKNQKVK